MVTLRFMGPLMRPDPDAVAHALGASATVSDLLGGLGYAADHQRFLQVSAQGRRLSLRDPLPADGEIVLALPMGGG
jgi:hypothetical protein